MPFGVMVESPKSLAFCTSVRSSRLTPGAAGWGGARSCWWSTGRWCQRQVKLTRYPQFHVPLTE